MKYFLSILFFLGAYYADMEKITVIKEYDKYIMLVSSYQNHYGDWIYLENSSLSIQPYGYTIKYIGFKSIDDAIKYLKDGKIEKNQVLGFWKLGKEIELDLKKIKKEKEVKIEQQPYTEYQWKVK